MLSLSELQVFEVSEACAVTYYIAQQTLGACLNTYGFSKL